MGEAKNRAPFGFVDVCDQSRMRAPLTFVSAVLRICCTLGWRVVAASDRLRTFRIS
ncbi:hypothetical protein J2X44_000568 [Sphingopyxis sp. BE259]|nr:hypothetical protein [Sphingopyxis sp. BE122]MDR7226032.1 hypothetical protein [Sphingopyxis sp. BE259]